MTERPRRAREYTAPGITVTYEPRRCIHAAECVRGLPQVFDTAVHPWIMPEHAPADEIAAIIRRCPTGALHYTFTASPAEQPETPTVVEPRPDGPLFMRGDLVIRTPNGEVRDTRAALCRCGQSGNKPFCDGTHRRVGWTSEGGTTGE